MNMANEKEKEGSKLSKENHELMVKATEAIEYLQKEKAALERKVALLSKKRARRPVRKDVPPKQVDKKEGDVDHDPTGEQEDNEPSAEGDTKPATDTTGTEDAFTKALEKLSKTVEDRIDALEKKVPEIVKASTPTPFGWTPEVEGFRSDVAGSINKSIETDRKGGVTEQARYDTDRIIQKSLGMVN